MPKVNNPFYNDPYTAQISQNIGQLILGQESPLQMEEKAARNKLIGQRSDYYGANAAKARADTSLAQTQLDARGQGAMWDNSLRYNGIDPSLPQDSVIKMLESDPQLKKRVLKRYAISTGSIGLTGNTNAEQLEKAGRTAFATDTDLDYRGGALPQQQYITQGIQNKGQPLYNTNSQGITTNLAGGQTVGSALTNSIVGEHTANSARAYAAAQKDRAETSIGKLVTEYTGRVDENGVPIFNQRAQKPGESVRVLPAADYMPKKGDEKKYDVGFKTIGDIDGEINTQLGVAFDKDDNLLEGSALPLTSSAQTAIRSRAYNIYRETGNAVDSVRQALEEAGALVPTGAVDTLWYESGTDTPDTNQKFLDPEAVSRLKNGVAAELEPEIVSRLKNGIATELDDGTSWTLKDGRPYQLK
jgi:hypothetical protein